MLKVLFRFLQIIGLTICAFSLVGFLGRYGLAFDTFSHFRFQYALALAICLIGFRQLNKAAPVILFFFLLNTAQLIPLFTAQRTVPSANYERLSILDLNLAISNLHYEAVRSLIQETNADVVCLQELTPEWMAQLEPVLKPYLYRTTQIQENPFGIGVFSKLPSAKMLSVPFEPKGLGINYLVHQVQTKTQTVSLLNVHTLPPIGREYFEFDVSIAPQIEVMRKSLPDPFILVGDINASPWSYTYQLMLQASHARDSLYGFGLQPSWPTFAPWALRIPIDHLFVSNEITVLNRKTGHFVGSDHLPVYVELAIPSKGQTTSKTTAN